MLDQDKTREQLVNELDEMRRKLAELEPVPVNIAELKLTEDALRQSEQNFRVIFERSPAGIIRFNSDGIVTDCNQAYLNVSGSTRDQVIGFNLLVSLRNETVKSAVQSALSGKIGQYSGEYTFVTGGATAWVNIIYTPVFNSDGSVSGVIGIFQDVTGRKKAEKALWDSEQTLNSILAACPIGIGFTAYNRTLLWANQAWLDLFGFEDKKQFLGQSPIGLYPSEEEFNRVREIIYPFLEKGQIGETDTRMVRKNGDVFDAHIRMSPLNPLEPQQGVIAIIADITPRKVAEREKEALMAQLLQSQKMETVGTLVGGLAHDFNNMLQIILGYTQLLMMDKEEDHEDYPDLQSIVRTVRDGAELVSKLLMFGREAPIRPVSLDLNQQIKKLIILMSHTLPKTITVKFNPADGPLFIHADPSQIDQAIMNLAINASDAMPDGGRLTIQTSDIELDDEYCRLRHGIKPGRYVMLCVSDTGRGMDEQTLARVFDPFFSTKEKGTTRGTGLGLSVVQGIVAQHDGHTTCDSEPGKGTELKIYFPAVEPPQKSSRKRKTSVQTVEKHPILFVEDDPFLADQAKRILAKAGYSVITAANGAEALEIYQSRDGKISLVILDLLMPVMSGQDCLRELVKVDPSVRVLIASGFSPDMHLEEEVMCFARGFVHKPYNMSQLLTAIESVQSGND
jgi:two-component system cell cycle sensor histidine kinase/response regulator CckA